MLKVKHLSRKNWKKAGIFTKFARKIERSIFCNLVSRFSLILNKIWFSIECKLSKGASLNINRVMAVFSPQPLKKMNIYGFFRQSDPPRKSQNVKLRNFCNGF